MADLPDLDAGPLMPGDEYRSVDAVLDRYISGAEMNDGNYARRITPGPREAAAAGRRRGGTSAVYLATQATARSSMGSCGPAVPCPGGP
jgi:hypothetical protein